MAETDNGQHPDRNGRRKRVQRIKAMMRCAILAALFIPAVFSIVTFTHLMNLFRSTEEMLEQILASYPEEKIAGEAVAQTSVFATAPLGESVRIKEEEKPVLEEEENKIKIYLTFDDGPSSNTGAILDVLKEYKVKATFFVTGKTDQQSRLAYKRIVEEGHTLGMHSYSHKYQEIYQSLENFSADLTKLQEYLYEETGVWCRYCRFPGGSSNQVSKTDMRELARYLEQQDIGYFDWNIASGDAVSGRVSAQMIADNCIAGIGGKRVGIVLLHDMAEKKSTVEALPQIIEGIQAMEHTELLPITDDTIPIRHIMKEE